MTDLLTGPTFYRFDHTFFIASRMHKVVAVHRSDTSTAHYWTAEGVDPDDVLLSIRPAYATRRGVVCDGPQRKVMVKPDQPLTAWPAVE